MKYAIAIVTYNRIELLKECIQACLSQTLTPDRIIIVNNSSTDGTTEYLNTLSSPIIQIKHMPENVGGAGGFYECMKISSETDAQYTIIIDDDAILTPDYAAQIFHHAAMMPDVKAFAGAVYMNGNIDVTHRQLVKHPGFIAHSIPATQYEADYFDCDFASFCGLVVSNEIIRKIGLPEKDYFIWYDDTEYSIRIRKETKIAVIPSAKLNHKTVVAESQHPRRYTWKDYYGLKNRLHMVRKHGSFADVAYLRIYLFLTVRFRNWLFHVIHLQGYDWNFERETYKKAVKK